MNRRVARLGREVRRVSLLIAIAVATGLAGCGDSERSSGETFRVRGVIEGFYGRPYTTAERARLLRFIGERGMNAYVYAPKNDPKHRDLWRDPYTADELADFKELARVGEESGVRVYFAISPGITYDREDPGDWALLEAKLRAVHETGITGFALLFDDIFSPSSDALDPSFQAELAQRVADLVGSLGRDTDYWFIGNFYAGTGEDLAAGRVNPLIFPAPVPPAEYYDAYAALIAPELPIMWTGPAVISPAIDFAVASGFRAFARRPVIVWDNYPANDIFPEELFMGPYLARDRELPDLVDGIVMNLMTQPTAGLIAVATGAAYMRDPRGYDPERSWREAIAALGGDGEPTLGRFTAQHRGHPFLEGAVESPDLAERIAAAFPTAGSAPTDARAELRDALAPLAEISAGLGRDVPDAALIGDVEPWAVQLERLARAGLLGLDALEGRASAESYRSARAEALASRLHVAKDGASSAIAALAGAPGNRSDRFADLFAAIDSRLPQP